MCHGTKIEIADRNGEILTSAPVPEIFSVWKTGKDFFFFFFFKSYLTLPLIYKEFFFIFLSFFFSDFIRDDNFLVFFGERENKFIQVRPLRQKKNTTAI